MNQRSNTVQQRAGLPARQSGMGMFGILMTLLILGSVLSIGLQIVPLYLDNNTMSKVLDGMATEDGLSLQTDGQLEKLIIKRFKVNNVRDFKVRDNIDINRTRNGVQIVMDYEIRDNIFRNLDFVVSFEKTIELRN